MTAEKPQSEASTECKHTWRYVFGLNAEPNCVRVYDCEFCNYEKIVTTPKFKSGDFGEQKVVLKLKEQGDG